MLNLMTPVLILWLSAAAWSQESQPALNALEKEFQETLTGATLAGRFTVEGSQNLSEDKYTIEKVSKVKDSLWRFEARVQYGSRDIRIPITLEVKWAGDTPVIMLTDASLAGLGTYTARVVIYRGQYAGTWSGAGGRGGQLFGRVVKEKSGQ